MRLQSPFFVALQVQSPLTLVFHLSSLFSVNPFLFLKVDPTISDMNRFFLLTHRTIPNISNNDIPYTLIIPHRKLGSVFLGWSIQIKVTKWGSHKLLILSISPCNFGIMEESVPSRYFSFVVGWIPFVLPSSSIFDSLPDFPSSQSSCSIISTMIPLNHVKPLWGFPKSHGGTPFSMDGSIDCRSNVENSTTRDRSSHWICSKPLLVDD